MNGAKIVNLAEILKEYSPEIKSNPRLFVEGQVGIADTKLQAN
jgi:hypothetical protein